MVPLSFSDTGDMHKELTVLDDTTNQISIDQAVLEEAPLPESMEKKRSARSGRGTIMPKTESASYQAKTFGNVSRTQKHTVVRDLNSLSGTVSVQ